MEYKIDLSWCKGLANAVLSKEVQKALNGFSIARISCETPYLYYRDGGIVLWGADKAEFNREAGKEVSVNDVLSGRWKAKEMTKSDIEKALGYAIKIVK